MCLTDQSLIETNNCLVRTTFGDKQNSKFMRLTAIFMIVIGLIACKKEKKPDSLQIIVKAIEVHGGDKFLSSTVSFDFRNKSYTVARSQEKYIYTRSFQDSSGFVQDSLVNSVEFTRHIDSELQVTNKEWADKYASSINSVLYFFQLPYLLRDPAVITTDRGTSQILDKVYQLVEVKFKQENGGTDFDDIYMYWFDQQTGQLDFFGYNYQVDGGGTRFRKAINRRTVNGIMIQDYINYRPKDKFPELTSLVTSYQNNELIKLSEIVNEEVIIRPYQGL
jgi:hypothetical protein